jgi:competence protein ComEA
VFADARAGRWEVLRHDPRVVAGLVAIVVVATAFAWWRAGATAPSPAAPGAAAPTSAATATTSPRTLVHVVGAVRAPGVVELSGGARVRDALAAAGGPSDDADAGRLNLAAPVADGQRIEVPRVGDPPVAPAAGGAPSDPGAPPGPLNLNTATAADLEELPGIGPTLAAAIVRERERRGRFESVDDLQEVRGIGEQRLADIRDLVAV